MTDPIELILSEGDSPQEVEFPLGIQYWYSGKPKSSLTVGKSYTRLDVPSWAPKKDGLTLGMLYLNCSPQFKPGATTGTFRTRLVREGTTPDDTAYQTWTVVPGSPFLLTHVWFEKGEAKRPLHYEVVAGDNLLGLYISTRYAKFVCIPFDVLFTLLFKTLKAG